MKIKLFLLIFLMLITTKPTFAEEAKTMCVIDGLRFIVLYTSVNGDETPYVDSDNKRFSIMFNSDEKNYHRRITGIASCNEIHTTDGTESGTAVAQNTILTELRATTSDTGQYCWCKMEPVYDSTDTTHFPTKVGLASYWQYLTSYNDNASCAADCTTDCANAIANDTNDFRTVMFNSIW